MTPEQLQQLTQLTELVNSMRSGEDIEFNEATKRFILGNGMVVMGTEPPSALIESVTQGGGTVEVTKAPVTALTVQDGDGNIYKLAQFN